MQTSSREHPDLGNFKATSLFSVCIGALSTSCIFYLGLNAELRAQVP